MKRVYLFCFLISVIVGWADSTNVSLQSTVNQMNGEGKVWCCYAIPLARALPLTATDISWGRARDGNNGCSYNNQNNTIVAPIPPVFPFNQWNSFMTAWGYQPTDWVFGYTCTQLTVDHRNAFTSANASTAAYCRWEPISTCGRYLTDAPWCQFYPCLNWWNNGSGLQNCCFGCGQYCTAVLSHYPGFN